MPSTIMPLPWVSSDGPHLMKRCPSTLLADGDPSNYLTYFKRAAVYLAMGQTKKALPDLTSSISLKPDFLQVCLCRG